MHSDKIRELVKLHRRKGKKLAEIGHDFHLSKSSIQSLLHYKKKSHKLKSGPKCKIDKRESTKITRFVASNNLKGIKVNCRKVIEEVNVPVSRRTMNNWLIRKDYIYQKSAQKIYLSKEHCVRRVDIVSSWIHENIEWENSVFSDEKRFTLDGPDNW